MLIHLLATIQRKSKCTDALREGEPVTDGAERFSTALPTRDDLPGSGRSANRQPPDRPHPPEAVCGENKKVFQFKLKSNMMTEEKRIEWLLELQEHPEQRRA